MRRQKAEGRRRKARGQRLLFAVLFLLLPFALSLLHPVVAAAEFAPADSWPQFRGNQQLTGFSRSSLPRRLRILWT
ncbi:MAG: hypothetical protein ACRD68_14220, partial [Pyrinomonadaceae bacterium]